MTTNLTTFAFDHQQVRTITDEDGNPWFLAKDVCDILGTETRDIRKILDVDEISDTNTIHIGGISMENGGRAPLVISEPGRGPAGGHGVPGGVWLNLSEMLTGCPVAHT